MLFHCSPFVYDVGPPLKRHRIYRDSRDTWHATHVTARWIFPVNASYSSLYFQSSRSFVWAIHVRAIPLGHYVFFLCFRWARALDLGSALPFCDQSNLSLSARVSWVGRWWQHAHNQKNMCFPKKQLISGDKKNIPKKTRLFQEIKKHFFSYVFLCLFFFRRPQ